MARDPASRRRNLKRRLWAYGGIVASLWAFYAYQPLRIDWIPRRPPQPNPRVDPESGRLFHPGSRVVVVTAHPDDSEFYSGGFLTKLHLAGARLSLIVCTDGDKGYYPWGDSSGLARVRRAEQRAAAEAWGAREVAFLAYPDGRLRTSPQLVEAIRRQLAILRPDYVVCFDGDYPPRISHGDHRAAGEAARLAAQGSSARWLLQFATSAPNYWVDVTERWNQHESLVAMHRSQFSGKRLEFVLNMVREHALEAGETIGTTYGIALRAERVVGPEPVSPRLPRPE